MTISFVSIKDSSAAVKNILTFLNSTQHIQAVVLLESDGSTEVLLAGKLGLTTETPAATPTTASGLNGLLRALMKILEGGAENYKATVVTASQNEQLITSTDGCALNEVHGFNAQSFALVIGVYDGNAAPVAPGTPITWVIALPGFPFEKKFGALKKFPNGMGLAILKDKAGANLDEAIFDQTTVEVRYTP